MSRSNGGSGNFHKSSWWIQRQRIVEEKKSLASKIGNNSTTKPITSNNANNQLTEQKKINVLPATMEMELLGDDGVTHVKPVKAIEQLAGFMLHAATTKQPQFVLLWPGTVRSIALAHAVATAACWKDGNKKGFRTLLYPAKSNFLQALNHAHINRSDITLLANSLYEPQSGLPNSHVKVSFPAKDAFLFSINSFEPIPGESIHPSVAELLPHFFAARDFKQWRSCDGNLLRHIKAKLQRKNRGLLNEYTIPQLSSLASAPDALLAISWRSSLEDIRNAFRELKHGTKPDVVVLDVTRAMRKNNPSWRANLLRFVDELSELWPADPPPILFAADEPHIRNQILQAIKNKAGKKSEVANQLFRSGLPINGILCTAARDGLIGSTVTEPLHPSVREIKINITDTEAAEVIALVDKLRNSAGEQKWQEIFESTTTYLSNLAALPSSTTVLTNWLNEADVPMVVRENFSWPVYRSRLEEILRDPAFTKRPQLKRIIDEGSRLWKNYENGTPLARLLADLIEEHTRGYEKCCVTFTRPTARRLAERYFETYDGYPAEAGFEVLRDCVRFVVSRNLDAELDSNHKETTIFAGLDEESLLFLMLDNRVSSPAYVLVTRRNAAYLKATLRMIKATPGFEGLNNRIDMLLSQLPEFTDIDAQSLYNRSDFVMPTFSFEQGLSMTLPEYQDHDPDAWEIILENGLHLQRGPKTRAYLYDPSLAHTLNRGFRAVNLDEVRDGDRLFVLSFELRELIESALRDAGIPISADKRFENDLRTYHTRVTEMIANIPGGSLTEKAHDIYQRMTSSLNGAVNMPAENTVKTWLDVERFKRVSFEDAKPGAPRHEATFKSFAQTIGIQDYEAIFFWKCVIQPLRGIRRADGRRVSDAYTDLLLEPESAVVHNKLNPAVVSMLLARAKENVYVIEAIYKPQGEMADE